MICWFKYPFIRLLIPFATGIWLAFFKGNVCVSEKVVVYLLIILLILLASLILSSVLIKNYRYRYVFSLLLNVFLLLSGFLYVRIHDYKLKVNGLPNIEFTPKHYVARLCECPAVKDNSVKVMMELMEIEDVSLEKHKFESKIIAYFEKNESSLSLKYGDCIIFHTNPEEVKKPPNPEQFDYKEYLYKKGVTHQVYLKSDKWLNLNCNKSNLIYKYSYSLRDFLLLTMQRLGVKDEEYAVAAAILLGYDDSLPMDLRQKYVAAGAMHILCVSGLHVGVIFMVFSYLLFFLDDRKKTQRLLKHLLLLLLIWFYALLAGLAPSILRATIMLSFVVIGNVVNRKGVLLNSLAASALILLCINPANLFDIGFMLSYVAVIGIVVLQKPISKLVYSKYKIVNKIWEITSVTIAAQIATVPFTIYYFHQFPTYFWLSNLFMTPISSVVIIGGMIMLLVFFIPYINIMVAFFVSKMICVMNLGVEWIESLPFSIIKGLYIDTSQFVILLLILLSLLLFVELKEKRLFFCMMILSSLFLFVNLNNVLKQKNQKEMVIYSINNATAIDFLCGREHFLLSDSIFFNDKSSFSYNIENFLVKKGVFFNGKTIRFCDNFDDNFVKKRKSVVIFGEKALGMSDGSDLISDTLSYKITLDFMFVYGKKRQSLSLLLNVYNFDYLIIDRTVPAYLSSGLIEESEKLGIKYHSIREKGAFVVK
jgi:competence protein ComEC